jgi:hypothetical protein
MPKLPSKPQAKPHLFLNNPRGEKKYFDPSRGRNEDEIPASDKPAEAYSGQKSRFRDCLSAFNSQKALRGSKRTLNIPAKLEYIKIDFFIIFNDDNEYKTKKKFINQFGLLPVLYTNFNQSVLFVISDLEKFNLFKSFLEDFTNSSNATHPSGTPYGISTIIQSFEFLSTQQLLDNAPAGDIILSLIVPPENIRTAYDAIYKALINYLKNLTSEIPLLSYDTDGISVIEIKNIAAAKIIEIADNFDIVFRIQSLRVPVVRDNEYNVPDLTWNITIDPPNNKEIKIGILDNGVSPIAPLRSILLDYGFDITNKIAPNALTALNPHGTAVASLAALGLDYFDTTKNNFIADAYIVPIKILNFNQGNFNIYEIESTIRKAIKRGVKLFNLSVCGPGKNYNSAVSEYAFLLDRLAYKYDVLIFIATGNLPFEDIEKMQADIQNGNHADLHGYPNHFYNPNKASANHKCECTNVCLPGESFNNITVGAIAENGINGTATDLTPFKELPSYYTRKHHVDYNQTINGTNFKKSQKNFRISKPDIVMPGGDVSSTQSQMQVVGLGSAGNDFYFRGSGTSFSSPLAVNIAAKILKLYPSLNMQSVKALILNSAEKLIDGKFLDTLIADIKNEEAQKIYHRAFARLSSKEKRIINSKLKSDDLNHKLVGHGTPVVNETLYSNSKSVTTIIQDSISIDSYRVINLNVPDYLLKYTKGTSILKIKATLSFKFFPVRNNHLAYNPLHISFNFIKSLRKDNPSKTSEIVSNRDHDYYKQFFSRATGNKKEDNKMKANARNAALGIKAKVNSWSDDFSPLSSKPFSNVQKLKLDINKHEISKVNGQISIVIRCTAKRDLDKAFMEWLNQNSHEFSLVVNISEKPNKELSKFDLYDEMVSENDLVAIVNADVEAESEAEAEE